MSLEKRLGRFARLTIRRFTSSGAFLGVDTRGAPPKEDDVLLLIGSEIPEGAQEGDSIDVFICLDSEDRPIATTRKAKLEVGQVAFLKVTAVTAIGAFVDWGLAKDLLVPFAEQTADLNVGQSYAIGVYIDDTGRLAGTMRVTEMLSKGESGIDWTLDEWVDGEAWRNDDEIGLFVIVEKEFVGLVPISEPHSLSRGESTRFRISNILPDGKIELSLRGHAHEEIAGDANYVLSILSQANPPSVGDKSSPEEIRRLFGLSKKAFKRAIGNLLRKGEVVIDSQGNVVKST